MKPDPVQDILLVGMSSKTLVTCLLSSLLKMPTILSLGFKQSLILKQQFHISNRLIVSCLQSGDTKFRGHFPKGTNSYEAPTPMTHLVLMSYLQMPSQARGVSKIQHTNLWQTQFGSQQGL